MTSSTISSSATAPRNFADQAKRRLDRRTDRRRVPPLAADERALSAAPRLHATDCHSLWHAVSSRQMRQLAMIARRWDKRLRPLHHPPEYPVQLDQAGGHARHSGGSGRRRDARHPDLRQLHPQCHRPIIGRARQLTRSPIRARLPSCSVSGRHCTRNSPSCRASSRSP